MLKKLAAWLKPKRPEEDRPPNWGEPLPPIVLVDPACPYCRVIQDPPPQRRKKCRDCGQVIHTHTDPEARKRYLLTAEESEHMDRERRDARWKELSAEIESASQSGDWGALSQAYGEQASILFGEGRPHHDVAQEAARAQLRSFQKSGIKKVKILTVGVDTACAGCSPLEGQVFSVAEALEQMPIPLEGCQGSNSKGSGWCRCLYRPVIP